MNKPLDYTKQKGRGFAICPKCGRVGMVQHADKFDNYIHKAEIKTGYIGTYRVQTDACIVKK